MEKILRERIQTNVYWKEVCFGLSMDTLLDKVVELKYIGGCYGNQIPTEFLCLLFKCLCLTPSEAMILEFIHNKGFKYLTVFGLVYYRLVGSSVKIYQVLEPFLLDYRRIVIKTSEGFEVSHIDEIVDDLLTKERMFGTILPRLTKRAVLESQGKIGKRTSPLEKELEE